MFVYTHVYMHVYTMFTPMFTCMFTPMFTAGLHACLHHAYTHVYMQVYSMFTPMFTPCLHACTPPSPFFFTIKPFLHSFLSPSSLPLSGPTDSVRSVDSIRDTTASVVPPPHPPREVPSTNWTAGSAASPCDSPQEPCLRGPLQRQISLLQSHPDTRWGRKEGRS